MKKTQLLITAVAIVICAALAGFSSAIATDTSNDPLVTMSYIEEVLTPRLKSELITYIQNNVTTQSGNNGTNDTPNDGSANTTVDTSYTILNLKKDQFLYPLGPTEIILRSGKALVISPFMDQGINDMTNGSELFNSDELPRYHYCLIPRGNDGRGIIVTTDEIYIMVRGEFEIREQ